MYQSSQINNYKYYELEDMRRSLGCRLCHVEIHHKLPKQIDPFKRQEEECAKCPVFMAVKLTKEYAKVLADYESRYIDDGK